MSDLKDIEAEFIRIGLQVAVRMDGLVKDIIERYECDCCNKGVTKLDDLDEIDAQDAVRYLAFSKIRTELATHPDFDWSKYEELLVE